MWAEAAGSCRRPVPCSGHPLLSEHTSHLCTFAYTHLCSLSSWCAYLPMSPSRLPRRVSRALSQPPLSAVSGLILLPVLSKTLPFPRQVFRPTKTGHQKVHSTASIEMTVRRITESWKQINTRQGDKGTPKCVAAIWKRDAQSAP